MLKSLYVVIGLTVVLVALSMAVTVITQAITTIINSRGRHLRRGLTDLLQQLDPALNEQLSKAIATGILTHPLVSGSSTPLLGKLKDNGTPLALGFAYCAIPALVAAVVMFLLRPAQRDRVATA